MRVIFLDIDGTLNNVHEPLKARLKTPEELLKEIDLDCIKRLNKIIENTGAKVVISSSWRTTIGMDLIKTTLLLAGFKGEIVDRTPVKLSYVDRGIEIEWWLESFREKNGFDPEFIILDDMNFHGFRRKDLKSRFIYIEDGKGLTDNHVKEAIEKFTKN